MASKGGEGNGPPERYNIADGDGVGDSPISVRSSPVTAAVSPITVNASIVSVNSSDGGTFQSPQVQNQVPNQDLHPEANPTTHLNDGDVFQVDSLRRLPPGLDNESEEPLSTAARAEVGSDRAFMPFGEDSAHAAVDGGSEHQTHTDGPTAMASSGDGSGRAFMPSSEDSEHAAAEGPPQETLDRPSTSSGQIGPTQDGAYGAAIAAGLAPPAPRPTDPLMSGVSFSKDHRGSRDTHVPPIDHAVVASTTRGAVVDNQNGSRGAMTTPSAATTTRGAHNQNSDGTRGALEYIDRGTVRLFRGDPTTDFTRCAEPRITGPEIRWR